MSSYSPFSRDYDQKLKKTIDAERQHNADLSVESWKLLAQMTSQQVEDKEAKEYSLPRDAGAMYGILAGGAVGLYGGLGVGALITTPLGAAIGYGIGAAIGPSESSLETNEMANDVKTAIGVIRSGNTYHKVPGLL